MNLLKKLKNYMVILGIASFLGISTSGVLAFNPLGNACKAANTSASSTCQEAASQTANKDDNPVIKTLGWATKVISLIIGFVAIILIVVSGLNMITSAGNAENVASARKRLTGAVIGLALASLAWIIASYVINQLL